MCVRWDVCVCVLVADVWGPTQIAFVSDKSRMWAAHTCTQQITQVRVSFDYTRLSEFQLTCGYLRTVFTTTTTKPGTQTPSRIPWPRNPLAGGINTIKTTAIAAKQELAVRFYDFPLSVPHMRAHVLRVGICTTRTARISPARFTLACTSVLAYTLCPLCQTYTICAIWAI